MKRRYSFTPPTRKSGGTYAILLVCMAFLNAALPQGEPLSVGLLFAALSCGLNPLLCGVEHTLASLVRFSWEGLLSAGAQGVFLALVFYSYRKLKRQAGSERLAFAILVQLPFVLLFPHRGYELLPLSPLVQKAIIALFLFFFCALCDGALHALLFRAFRCRLPAHALAEMGVLWTAIGLGIARLGGETAFYAVAFCALFCAVLLVRSAVAVPFSVALSLPLCLAMKGILPCAYFAVYACTALLFLPYGKLASALALFSAFLLAQFAGGLFDRSAVEITLRLLACAMPALVLALLPEKAYKKAKYSLLFYRERVLPRVAINRNRRAVGERLYEVSALFRAIGQAFSVQQAEDNAPALVCARLTETLCAACAHRRTCADTGIYRSMEKLVEVGISKGKVSLVDLPSSIASACVNSAGLLFALNRHLSEYSRTLFEMENVRAGRALLAEQALGVSEIMKNIALEQSEEFSFSDEEELLHRAFNHAGILSSEIFLYGEGTDLTVSMTLLEDTDAKRVCATASDALGISLTLADKVPLCGNKACFILRKKAKFDAAFGVASLPKEDTAACGDTHSILKIDERRFLIALSDGMGSGSEARAVSDGTLTLIESFYKAKMPAELILSTVNRLVSYSADERFSCLDLASVDLDTGIADIVKIGSPVGFVLSQEKLRVLEGNSLPLGALDTLHPTTLRVGLGADDFLLFLSDGITSAFGSSTELYGYLSELRPLNPQSLAEDVLSAALTRYAGKAEDDMTVVAVRLLSA